MKTYYSYTGSSGKTTLDKKPENWEKKQLKLAIRCPSLEIAKMAYNTHLKIHHWRGQ